MFQNDNNLCSVAMFVTAASSSKKRLNLLTPRSIGVGERSVASSPKTRAVSSQKRGRSRRGRAARQLELARSEQLTDTEQLSAFTAGHSVASRILSETGLFKGHFLHSSHS